MQRIDGPFRISNDALSDPVELRCRIDDEGYLFMKGLQDKDKLLTLRRDMLGVMMELGWLVPGTDPIDGIADVDWKCAEGDVEYTEVYHEVYKKESFHRSGHWDEVVDVIGTIIGGPVLPHPCKIARLWFPQYTDHTTPVHQDFVHFQGSYDTYTVWTPVGDCPVELGPLGLIPGSHKVGKVMDHHFSLGAGSLTIHDEDLSGEWLSNDFEVGDCLIFHSLTVHQALPNNTEDRIRVSLDNRYQAYEIPIAEQMLVPHLSNLTMGYGWEEVYADWESDDLKYYWKNDDLEVHDKITTWGQIGFDEAIEQAKGGDEKAKLQLRRIVKRGMDDANTKRAADVLAEL